MSRIRFIGLCLCMVSLSEAQNYNSGIDHVLVRNIPLMAKDSFLCPAMEGFTEPLKDAANFTKPQTSAMESFRSKLAMHLRFIENVTGQKETKESVPFRDGCFVPVPLTDQIVSDDEAYGIFREDSGPGIIAPINGSLLKNAALDEAAQTVISLSAELVGVNGR